MASATVELSGEAVSYQARADRKNIGLITLSTDLTTERDFARIIPQDRAGVFGTRVAFDNPLTPENIRLMAPRITAAAELILPGEPLAAVCYSCTSASVVIGDEKVAASVHAVRPGVPVVTPSGAAVAALGALGARRISVLTPYLVETSEPMARYFEGQGLQIEKFDCLGIEDDRDMAYVERSSIMRAALAADTEDSEALFISCTALPALGVVCELEGIIGKPVVTSNQATAWALMRYAGLSPQPGTWGRLFERAFLQADQPSN